MAAVDSDAIAAAVAQALAAAGMVSGAGSEGAALSVEAISKAAVAAAQAAANAATASNAAAAAAGAVESVVVDVAADIATSVVVEAAAATTAATATAATAATALPWLYFALGAAIGLGLLLGVEALLLYRHVLRARFALAYPKLIRPEQVLKSEAEAAAIRNKDMHGTTKESCHWANAILRRFFVDNYPSIRSFLMLKIKEEIIDVKRFPAGWIIDSYDVPQLAIAHRPPTISEVAVLSKHTGTNALHVLFDLAFDSTFSVVVTLNLFFGLPISVLLNVSDLKGRILVEYTERDDMVTNVSFGFRDKPTMTVEMDILIAQLRFPVLNRLASSVVHTFIAKKLMLPQLKTKWARNGPAQPPYPWQVDFDEARMYIVPKQPERPASPAPAAKGAADAARPGTPASDGARGTSMRAGHSTSSASLLRNASGDSAAGGNSSTEPHAWKVHSYRKTVNCRVCGKALWGVARQGMRCKVCGMDVHSNCAAAAQGCNKEPAVGEGNSSDDTGSSDEASADSAAAPGKT